jgi:hypothetical protein
METKEHLTQSCFEKIISIKAALNCFKINFKVLICIENKNCIINKDFS